MKPTRIKREYYKAYDTPNTLPVQYVGRPTKFGNPFSVSEYGRAEALRLYSEWIKGKDVTELKGKNLACWCKLDEPCHADILLKLANP